MLRRLAVRAASSQASRICTTSNSSVNNTRSRFLAASGRHFAAVAAPLGVPVDEPEGGTPPTPSTAHLHGAVQHKVISLEDAVLLVHSGDTVCTSGFVAQGAPEMLLKGLSDRFRATGGPNRLTLFFGGGPGDWDVRGLNHLALEAKDGPPGTEHNMLSRTVGSHYGQIPLVAQLALDDKVEAWNLPMGSISRVARATASAVPGHFTKVGIGTFVDPDITGGKINQRARDSGVDYVTSVELEGQRYLWYKTVPINVALIRATTADPEGNLSFEHESLVGDPRVLAMAAKNCHGVVIAQVKRMAASNSIPTRQVGVPGPLVDGVVVVPDEDVERYHSMSYFTRHDAARSQEIKQPMDDIPKLPLNARKVIARRAAHKLAPGKIVNLGVGMPEGIASVAAEESVLEYVTMTTEAGAIGGLAASGKEFGPAANASSMMEMNQMFDFYCGGGLNNTFLGAAEVMPNGDVNVSRVAADKLTGPGGFIEITHATPSVTFMTTFTTKGLEVGFSPTGSVSVLKEGRLKKFVNKSLEVTFNASEAVKRGQKIRYVTERAVFKRNAQNEVLELIEIAPGVDLQRDILDQMEFEPIISPNLKTMDRKLFMDDPMGLWDLFFNKPISERMHYHADDHTMFVDLSGVQIAKEDDIHHLVKGVEDVLRPLVAKHGKINMVVNYDGFDCKQKLNKKYQEAVAVLQEKYYASARRFAGAAFRRVQLGKTLQMHSWDPEEMFKKFDLDGNGFLDKHEIRKGLRELCGIKVGDEALNEFMEDQITLEDFTPTFLKILTLHGQVKD
jgi:propionate CoA-transferase